MGKIQYVLRRVSTHRICGEQGGCCPVIRLGPLASLHRRSGPSAETLNLMPEVGLEPTSLAALGPKPSVYANFTTPARGMCRVSMPACPTLCFAQVRGSVTRPSTAIVVDNMMII